jgi:hypothetical protein
MWKMVHHKTAMTPEALQSAIQYRAIVQRDRVEPRISLDSLLLLTPLCSATVKVGLEPRGRRWVLVCGICTLAYVPKYFGFVIVFSDILLSSEQSAEREGGENDSGDACR